MSIDDFLEFEEKEDLFARNIDGLYYWMQIRMSIYLAISREKYLITGEKNKQISKADRFNYLFGLIKALIFNNPLWLCKKKDILIFQDAIIFNPLKNFYECPRTQVIMNNFNGTKLLIEDYRLELVVNKVQFEEVKFIAWPIFKSAVLRRMYSINRSSKTELEQRIKKEIIPIINKIQNEFNILVDIKKYTELVYRLIIDYKVFAPYFKKILERTQPLCIIEQCYYSFHKMVLNEAATKLNIPTIELQHGVMGRSHIAYNFKRKREISVFPKFVLTFSEYWNKVTRFPLAEDHIIATGYPYLEEAMKLKEFKAANKLKILFISQGAPGCLHAGDYLGEFAIKVCDYILKNKIENVEILYKLHPAECFEDHEIYHRFKQYEKLIKVATGLEMNIYDCFKWANVQVSISSTSVFEGLAFELDTYLLKCEELSDTVIDLVENGYGIWIKEPEDLIDRNGKLIGNMKHTDDFWKKNSINNIMDVINNIVRDMK